MKTKLLAAVLAIVLVLALFAGFIVIALYLPMFTMYNLM